MSDDTRKPPPRRSHPQSMPPEVPVDARLELGRRHHAAPRARRPDVGERVRSRHGHPEMPSEMFAQQMMSGSPSRRRPSKPPTPGVRASRRVVAVRPLDPMAMPARAPRSGPPSATECRPLRRRPPPAPRRAPARTSGRPSAAEPTGLELMDTRLRRLRTAPQRRVGAPARSA